MNDQSIIRTLKALSASNKGELNAADRGNVCGRAVIGK